MSSSSRCKKRERSLGSKGGGPPVMVPMSRKNAVNSRLANASPIESLLNTRPLGSSTRAPFFRQRAASGMSAVTAISVSVMCAAIQSSAASNPSCTIISSINSFGGIRIDELDTRYTFSRCLRATRNTSFFTGQASASMYNLITKIPFHCGQIYQLLSLEDFQWIGIYNIHDYSKKCYMQRVREDWCLRRDKDPHFFLRPAFNICFRKNLSPVAKTHKYGVQG